MSGRVPPTWVTAGNARLAWSDGTPRYVPLRPGTALAAGWSLVYLETRGWTVHRVGQAFHAHGPNGARWIGGWTVPDAEPRWWARLLARSTRTEPAGSGAPPAETAVVAGNVPPAPGPVPVAAGPETGRDPVAVR